MEPSRERTTLRLDHGSSWAEDMERVIVWHRWSAPVDPAPEAVSLAAAWRRAARERFLLAGAERLFELGGSAAFVLAGGQLARALELCASIVREARQAEQVGGVAYGIAVGAVARLEVDGVYVGEALERAQLLANTAQSHEVLLDSAARAASQAAFLFAGEVTLPDGLRATALDPMFPRKSDCQRSVTSLAPPAPPDSVSAQRALLQRIATSPGRQRVLLVAPLGHGVGALIDELAQLTAPSTWLALRATGAAIAPLSGLSYALRRLATSVAPESVLCGRDDREREAMAQLVAIREGDAVPRREAIVALRRYLVRASERGRRPLISVDPAPLIDPSSVGVIAEAVRDATSAPLVVMRTLQDAKPPAAYHKDGGFTELRLPALERHEAQALAAGLLGCAPSDDIARRAAVLGGDNPRAVIEAVRALVAAGDVVYDEGVFRWRRAPVGGKEPRTLEGLLVERVDALAPPLRRALEILAIVPDPADQVLGATIAADNGLLEDTWLRAVSELESLGFVRRSDGHVDVSAVVRQVLRTLSTPARDHELCSAVAAALERTPEGQRRFARATLAFYLAHAGRTEEAAARFLEVATLAGQLGYLRSGVRLAASAVECDGSPATRAHAAQLAQRLSAAQSSGEGATTRASLTGLAPVVLPGTSSADEPPPRAGATTPSVGSEARARAIEAIRARDYDEVERAIELMIAAGQDQGSVERLRVITLLIRGEHAAAQGLLDRLRARDSDGVSEAQSPRLILTAALAALASGDLESAVRTSLEVLARTREAGDPTGERAALSVLSLCYRELGREADAQRFEQAALAPSPPP